MTETVMALADMTDLNMAVCPRESSDVLAIKANPGADQKNAIYPELLRGYKPRRSSTSLKW